MSVDVWEADHTCDPVPAGVSVGRSRLAGTLFAECALCGWRCAYWECACELAHECARETVLTPAQLGDGGCGMTGYTITCPHGTWSAGPTHRTAITYATLRQAMDAARVHFDAHGCMPTVHDDPRTRRDYVGGAA